MQKILLAMVILACPLKAMAQEPPVLSLAEAQRIALAQAPLVKAGDLTAGAAAQDVTAARAAYYPQLSGSAVRAIAGDNSRIGAANALSDPTIVDRASAGLAASQLITDFGRTAALVDASRFTLKADQDHALSTRDATLLAVSQAYYQVLRAQALLRVAQETQKTRGALLGQVQALHDVKMKSDLDLSYAQQGVQQADLLALKANAAIGDGMNALREAMGGAAGPDFVLESPKTTPPPDNLDALITAALADNPDVQADQNNIRAAQARATAQARQFRPNVSAYGFTGVTPYREPDARIEPEYAAGGVNISMPFYTGGRITAESESETLRAAAATQSLAERRNRIVRDVSVLFNDAQTSYRNIALNAALVRNARQSYDLTQARYRIGSNSIVDLTEAQLVETQAEIDATNAIYDYLLVLAQLDFTAGRDIPGGPPG